MTLAQRIYNGTWPSSDRFFNTGGPEPVKPELLLQPRTADAAIYDYAGNYTFSAVGGPAVDAKSVLKGYKSIAIGSNAYLIQSGGPNGFNPGSGDFTIELAFRATSNCVLACKGDQTVNDRGWTIAVSTGGGVYFNYSTNGTSYVSVGGGTYGSGSNALVVVERLGGTLNVALNGVQVGTNAIGAGVIRAATDGLLIGAERGGGIPGYSGHLYAFRFSPGAARYPIAALPARLLRPFPTYNPSVWA